MTIDDQVFRDAKIEAIKAGMTCSAFAEGALREEASVVKCRGSRSPSRFRMAGAFGQGLTSIPLNP